MKKCKNCLTCHFQHNGKCYILTAPALKRKEKDGVCAFYQTSDEYDLSREKACDRLARYAQTTYGREQLEQIFEKYPNSLQIMKEKGYKQILKKVKKVAV